MKAAAAARSNERLRLDARCAACVSCRPGWQQAGALVHLRLTRRCGGQSGRYAALSGDRTSGVRAGRDGAGRFVHDIVTSTAPFSFADGDAHDDGDGGQVAAAAIPVGTREELVSLLGEAAELEHGLACSYLYAAFSLKGSTSDGLSAADIEVVRGWRATIVDVAEQEMLHLALVCNLLTAIGAAPHLRRPTMPHTSRYYPAGITIELRRFDDASLTRFIFLERPEHVEVEAEVLEHPTVDLDAEVPAAAPGALVLDEDLTDDAGAPEPASFSTVGHLYETIEAAFTHLTDVRGEANLFIGPPVAQATSAYFDMHDLVAVTDLASARAALEVLTTQGEGVRGDWTNSHYGRFLAIRTELRELVADDPGFEPAWPALDNPTEHASEPDERLVEDPVALDVMRLFNSAYTLMTVMLLRCFAHTDESEAALRVLSRSTVDLMEDVIEPLGGLLARLPARSGPTPTAGANFDFYRPVTLIPHQFAAWRIFHERLDELGAHAHRVHQAHDLAVVDDVGRALHAIARRIEPHLL